MKRKYFIISSIALLAAAGFGIAGQTTLPFAHTETASTQIAPENEHTITFAIGKMTCATCPITVRKAMQGVEGVASVSVDFDAKTATVIFDAQKTDAAQIGAASTNAGYPAAPVS